MAAEKDYLSLSVREFLAQTAAKTPTPGGGSVAGVVGGLAAALAEMSLNFTRGKKKYAQNEPYYAELAPRLQAAREAFEGLVAADVQAYELYQAAARIAEDDPNKPQAQQRALKAAVDVPRKATARALELLSELAEFRGRCNPFLVSDLVAAAALAVAAVRLSDYNVRINARMMDDPAAADRLRQASAGDRARAETSLAELEAALGELL